MGMEVLTGQNSGREVTRSDKNVVENEETSTNEKSIGNIWTKTERIPVDFLFLQASWMEAKFPS